VTLAIHGGAFRRGDKAHGQLAPMLSGLSRGYAVVSMNYPLSGEARFPAQINDVKGVGAGLDGVTGPGAGKRMPAPYVNMVFVEGAVLLPRTGADGEAEAYAGIGKLVGREPVGLRSELSAFGGGGLGCITQQVPAGKFVKEVS